MATSGPEMAVMVLRVDGNQAKRTPSASGPWRVLRAAAVDAFVEVRICSALGGAPGATIDAGRVAGALDALMAYLEDRQAAGR